MPAFSSAARTSERRVLKMPEQMKMLSSVKKPARRRRKRNDHVGNDVGKHDIITLLELFHHCLIPDHIAGQRRKAIGPN